jgi:hypothetical protein
MVVVTVNISSNCIMMSERKCVVDHYNAPDVNKCEMDDLDLEMVAVHHYHAIHVTEMTTDMLIDIPLIEIDSQTIRMNSFMIMIMMMMLNSKGHTCRGVNE